MLRRDAFAWFRRGKKGAGGWSGNPAAAGGFHGESPASRLEAGPVPQRDPTSEHREAGFLTGRAKASFPTVKRSEAPWALVPMGAAIGKA